jgi:hypothetical protein
MPESTHPSLKTPRISRVRPSRHALRSSLPLLGLRSSLFPLVTQRQPWLATPAPVASAIASSTLRKPEPLRFASPGPACWPFRAASCCQSSQRPHRGSCGRKLSSENGPTQRRPFRRPEHPLFTFAHPVSHPLDIVPLDFKRPPTKGRSIQL